MQPLFMDNPFMSQWLSMANAMAAPVRGFWLAEISRLQAAAASAMIRETTRAWNAVLASPLPRLDEAVAPASVAFKAMPEPPAVKGPMREAVEAATGKPARAQRAMPAKRATAARNAPRSTAPAKQPKRKQAAPKRKTARR